MFRAGYRTTFPVGVSHALTEKMSSWGFTTLQRVCADMLSYEDGRNLAPDVLDSFVLSLELVYRELAIMQLVSSTGDVQAGGLNIQQVCELVRQALVNLREVYDWQLITGESFTSLSSSVDHTGAVGRPRVNVTREQLSLLLESRFTVPRIADMISVYIRTIHRRMVEYGLSVQSTYSVLTDQELDPLVLEIQKEFPMCGNRQMYGHLASRGIRVQRQRVRESMRRVDPEGSLMRRLTVTNHHKYSVPAPRSLYHIDGNHKLIRYILLIACVSLF